MSVERLRIRFSKEGDLRLISHRDLLRLMERLFRRADIPLAMSQGFHPRAKMSLLAALALGIEGRDEVMEIQLSQPMTAAEVHARLASNAPAGMQFHSVTHLPAGTPKTRIKSATYTVLIPRERQAPVQSAIARLTLDPTADLEQLRLDGEVLTMRLRQNQQGGMRPRDVLALVDAADLGASGFPFTRTHVEAT
jgi:radical SAM-linked protein